MKKFAVSLIALSVLSTAAFATSDNSPASYDNHLPKVKSSVAASQNALSTGVKVRAFNDANYINASQLR